MHDTTQAAAPRTGHFLPIARLGLLAMMLALAACKGGKPGDGKGKDGKDAANKGPEAVPVEVAKAGRRSIAASYAGTAPLEARGESQVVAKTSGRLARVGRGRPAGARRPAAGAAGPRPCRACRWRRPMRRCASWRPTTGAPQQLVEQQMVSANDVDQTALRPGERARQLLRLARLELSYTTVTAPISGVVATRNIKPGNFVQINTPIFRIVDNSRLEATLNVPEREIAKLKAGQPVQLSVDALPGKTFAGRSTGCRPVVDSGSGTFRVICAFDGGGLLQPGMFGRIRIDYDQRADALVVPRTALLEDGRRPAVYVVEAGKACASR
jgi:membrane fusion protein (multidrug efflux system)